MTITPIPTAITSDLAWDEDEVDEETVVLMLDEEWTAVFVDVSPSVKDDDIVAVVEGNFPSVRVGLLVMVSLECVLLVEFSVLLEVEIEGDSGELEVTAELVSVDLVSTDVLVGVREIEVAWILVETELVKLSSEVLPSSVLVWVVELAIVNVVVGMTVVVEVELVVRVIDELEVVLEADEEELVVVAIAGIKASSCPSVELPNVVSNTIPSTIEGAPQDQYHTPAVPPVASCRVHSKFPFSAFNA
jgi:hypothetical protein